MAKKKNRVIKSEKMLTDFFNRNQIARRMKMFASMLLPPKTKFNFRFNIGDSSFTDWKQVVIGVPKYLIGKTEEEILMEAKATVIHETGHMLYSPEDLYKEFIKDYTKKLMDEGISEGLANKCAGYLINAIEDGHDENCAVISNPSHRPYIIYSRSLWWKNNVEPPLSDSLANGGSVELREVFDILFSFATLSTMGIMPCGFSDNWGSRNDLYQMIDKVKPDILSYISQWDMADSLPYLWKITDTIHPWLIDLLKKIPESDASNMMNDLQNAASNGQSSQGSGQGSSASGGQNIGQNPSQGNNGQQGKTSNGQQSQPSGDSNQQQGSGASLDANDSKSNGDTRLSKDFSVDNNDYGTDMNQIVEEALKNATSELYDGEHGSIVQADFDDLRSKGNHSNDEAEGKISNKELDDINDYYKNLDSNRRGGQKWNASFKKKAFTPSYPVTVPKDVLMESKMLSREFEKIFLNKKGCNAQNRRRGNLNTNNLWKVRTHDYNVFEKKKKPRETNYVFYVLVDGSGSMGYDKFAEALRACCLLEESLRNIAPVKIVLFHYGSGVEHDIIKEFANGKENKSWAFANESCSHGCNMDGFSIRVATKELSQRKENKKVLITLSDGQPNGPSGYDYDHGANDVREAVNEARRKGVNVFNIFFSNTKSERKADLPAFVHMYQKGIISCNPKQIGHELLRVVKAELKN